MYDPKDANVQVYQPPANDAMLKAGLGVMGAFGFLFFLFYITSRGWLMKTGSMICVLVGFGISLGAITQPVEPTRECTFNASLGEQPKTTV